jgi:hypothetical protein
VTLGGRQSGVRARAVPALSAHASLLLVPPPARARLRRAAAQRNGIGGADERLYTSLIMAGASSIKMMITNLTEKALISPDLARSRGRVISLYRDTIRHIPWMKQTYQVCKPAAHARTRACTLVASSPLEGLSIAHGHGWMYVIACVVETVQP